MDARFRNVLIERAAPPTLPSLESRSENPNLVWNSSYLITVNTNVSVRSDEENRERFFYAERAVVALNLLIDPAFWENRGMGREWQSMFKEGVAGGNRATEAFRGQLLRMKAKMFAEVGGKQHRLHLHGILSIDHTERLHLDYKVVRELFQHAYNTLFDSREFVPHLYINIRFIKTTDVTRQYILKNQPQQAIFPENFQFESLQDLQENRNVVPLLLLK